MATIDGIIAQLMSREGYTLEHPLIQALKALSVPVQAAAAAASGVVAAFGARDIGAVGPRATVVLPAGSGATAVPADSGVLVPGIADPGAPSGISIRSFTARFEGTLPINPSPCDFDLRRNGVLVPGAHITLNGAVTDSATVEITPPIELDVADVLDVAFTPSVGVAPGDVANATTSVGT